MLNLTLSKSGAILIPLRVTPRSRTPGLGGIRSGALLVGVSAAPVDGGANTAVVAMLAKALGVPKSNVEIARGDKGRDKVVSVVGVGVEEVRGLLGG